MGTDKSELKIALLEDMGLKADDRVEALTAELRRGEGGAAAFEIGAKKIESDVYARFKRDIDEGTLPKDPNEAVDKYLKTCVHYLNHLAAAAKANIPIMTGKMQEATAAVDRLKAEQNEEKLKFQAVKSAQAEGEVQTNEQGEAEAAPAEGRRPVRRPSGVRPAPSLKHQRQAQETPSEPEPELLKVPAVPVRKSKPAKAVKRRAKNT